MTHFNIYVRETLHMLVADLLLIFFSFGLKVQKVECKLTTLVSLLGVGFSKRYTTMASELYTFGPYKIRKNEVFYATNLSNAMVNLRPILAGHVLVCPRREVLRFVDLTADEASDLWLTAQKVGIRLELHHSASSLTFTIQDGPESGQTVPHVHIHIVPRRGGDFENNDEIYEAIDEKEKELAQKLDLDKGRKDRSPEEMAQEADAYRQLFL